MKKFLMVLAAAAFLTGCGGPGGQTLQGPKLSLLFIGNSYTYVNDLPQMLVQLAASGGHPLSVEMVAPGGWTLAQHANAQATLDKITGGKWNYVVLQDQSVMPSLVGQREGEMYPAVRSLALQIRQAGAIPLLYLTWGRQKGLPEAGFNDYPTMQEQLTQGYLGIAKELGLKLAPVGPAWKTALGRDPGLELWGGDGSHPSIAGTYLAACVFYAALYGASPEGLDFKAELPGGTARALQKAAAETVLAQPAQWNLN